MNVPLRATDADPDRAFVWALPELSAGDLVAPLRGTLVQVDAGALARALAAQAPDAPESSSSRLRDAVARRAMIGARCADNPPARRTYIFQHLKGRRSLHVARPDDQVAVRFGRAVVTVPCGATDASPAHRLL